MNLDDSLRDKIRTNGAFEDVASLSQAIKFVLRRGKNWETMPPESKEALELSATSIARILTGDHLEPNHWSTLATYGWMRGNALELAATKPSNRLAEIQAARQAAGIKIMGSAIEDEPDA